MGAAAGRVYAFEPLPANIAFLRRHLELNRIRNVEVLQVAVSDRDGTASFAGESTRAMGKLEPGGSLTVEMRSLDQLIADVRIAPPDCIKMDIEGGEFRALLGATRCFEERRPQLFLATHGKTVHEECCRLLASWNYEWVYTARDSDSIGMNEISSLRRIHQSGPPESPACANPISPSPAWLPRPHRLWRGEEPRVAQDALSRRRFLKQRQDPHMRRTPRASARREVGARC